MLDLIASMFDGSGRARYLQKAIDVIDMERRVGEGVTIEKNVCMRVAHASEPRHPLFLPSPWPLTSVAYNKSCLDQSHRACKTLQTSRNQITLLPYPFPRLSRRHQAFRQKQGSPKSRMHRPRQMGKLLNFIVIKFAKN